MEFSYLDIFFAIPLIWGIVRGLMSGFIRSLSVFVGLILGITLAQTYAADLSPTIQEWFTLSARQCLSIAYVTIFVAVMIVVAIIARILDKFLHLILLGWLNKLLGALFGFFKWAIILSFFIMVIEYANSKFEFLTPEKKSESLLYEPIKNVVPTIMPYVKL
jgi:membrane protein required for colicin V production